MRPFVRRRHRTDPVRSRPGPAPLVFGLVGLLWPAAGCGSDDDAATAPDGDAATAPTITEPTLVPDPTPTTERDPSIAPSPDELGDEIGVVYLAVYDDVVDTLADRPEPAEATERLGELKEEYIQRLVVLGQYRETMAAPDRATVDAGVSRALLSLPEETLAAYQDAIDHYADDAELRALISSFNIIGQYASFDLLRDQEPEEAARLGIG